MEEQSLGLNKILFVDDEENVLKSLKRLFMDEESFEIFTATSGEAGLKVISDNTDIALIVSDQRMPQMPGIEFLEKSREIVPDAIRILLTGYADGQAAIDAINKAAAHSYISKPWDDSELLSIIRASVSRYALKKENERLTALVRKQNAKIKKWNAELGHKVQEQTIELTEKNKKLDALNVRLKSNFTNIIQSFSLLLGLRDREAPVHAKKVAKVSVHVARAMGLHDSDIENIMIASILHDTGKIGLTDILLSKSPTEMDPDELKEYELHTVRGQTAVGKIEDMAEAGKLIRHHHECYDGSGFPDKLNGEDIPNGSRIIAIADYFDKNFSRHTGYDAVDKTLEDTKKLLGKAFDPGIFPYLNEAVNNFYKEIKPTGSVIEKELLVKNLMPNMIISRDVRSGSEVLLLSKGAHLNEMTIRNLNRTLQFDPSDCGVFVWVNK